MNTLFNVLVFAIRGSLQFVFRSVVVKFGTFFALWYVTTGFVEVLKNSGVLPKADALTGAFASIPPSAWYWLELLAFPEGMPIVLAAMANRFVLRRIPLMG
ncbi:MULTISPECIES: DUF2523 family protein [Pandoraea]|uniref:DUF2523 family protein n=1 Tax=Pandoraea TaxID=93217 RepID=UPI001F5C5589|nr:MULTISPECIES: DUF2523 family protein [Pandoraea]MCI3206458.1 DUF2523 domain-containing protein [Pandoraea sp. LA3]MDN4584486.1 DUF2523 domain-containing protein [Pandoraea capi]